MKEALWLGSGLLMRWPASQSTLPHAQTAVQLGKDNPTAVAKDTNTPGC